MTQIKASEVKPGMEVEWTQAGVTRKCVAETVDSSSPRYGVNLHTSEGGLVHIPGNAEVTVLSEPQPEEPKAFGACVRVDGVEYIRDGVADLWFTPKLIDYSRNHRWEQLTARGQVEVVNPNPFARAEEAPERVDEWDTWDDVPEGVVVINPGRRYCYRKDGGKAEVLAPEFPPPVGGAEWLRVRVSMDSQPGPWTRVTDA